MSSITPTKLRNKTCLYLLQIRGPHYLVDKKKLPAAQPMFELVAVDLLQLEEPIMHICQYLPSIR